MNRSEHLTENQLNAYFGDSALAQEAKHEIGRHLLQCDFCLKRLPQPTVEQFWTALMTDENADDAVDESESLAARLRHIVQKLMQPKIFALSAVTLAVVLFFSAFIWLSAVKSSETEKEVAENFAIKDTQSVLPGAEDDNVNLPQSFPNVENGNHSPSSQNVESKLPIFDDIKTGNRSPARITAGRNLAVAAETQPKQNSKPAPRNDSHAQIKSEMPREERSNVSSTRGGSSPKCGDQPSVDLAVGMNDETVILKWKKIPNAAKYHLYVSDEKEILLDEFETAEATSYVLKKPLDLLKTYKWKIVVILKNGEAVIGDSQKFTVKDLKANQRKFKKKEKSDIRCSEDK